MTQQQHQRQGTMILGAFAALFDDQGRILCVRRGYGPLTWTTPGGMVEPGESPVEAVCREVLEETGWRVAVDHLIGVYSLPIRNDHVLFFRVTAQGRDPWQPNEEIVEVGFFERHALPAPMSQRAAARIRDAFDGRRGLARVFSAAT